MNSPVHFLLVNSRMNSETLRAARRWIKIADRDLAVANVLPERYSDGSAFHYQQAAEKYLKGFLAAHDVPFQKSGDIGNLVLEASKLDTDFLSLSVGFDLDSITSFATRFLQPSDAAFPTMEDLIQAKRFCEKAKAMVDAKIVAAE